MRSAIAFAFILTAVTLQGRVPEARFYDDDPIAREPETQDASGARPREISLVWDTLYNLFAHRGDPTAVRALDVNTVDEIPDSSWFINRVGARPLSPAEIERGPNTTQGPAGLWTIVSGKSDGIMPGFVVRDAAGVRWFVKLDPPAYPELATGAEVVSTKLLWALGYHVPENHVAILRPAEISIDAKAAIKDVNGRNHPLTMRDVTRLLARGARRADGTYRVMASKALDGAPLGPFLYFGTRADDPNDVIAHEDRRSLRALGVFAAWLNHVDAKSINTLDTLVAEDGRRVVRHHLLDFGSTLGSAGVGPRDYEEGHEYLYEGGSLLKGALSGGLLVPPWRRIRYDAPPSVGRFDAIAFDPRAWKPRVPNPAFMRARADDLFWAARKLAALDSPLIEAAVSSARYSDPAAARYLVNVLIHRRRTILEAYLPALNPIVEPSLSPAGTLRFSNATVDLDVAIRHLAYTAVWYVYDVRSNTSNLIGQVTNTELSLQAPSALPAAAGAFVHVEVSAVGGPARGWLSPVHLFFRHESHGWKLVGLERDGSG